MSLIMDTITSPPQELLPPSLYYGLIISKDFDPEALIAEVEDALRFVWPEPAPVHQITETSWNLYTPAELLALIEENERTAATRQAIIDNPDLFGFDATLINGIVYRNQECANCGHVRLMPADVTLCVPCDAAPTDPDQAERDNALFAEITNGLELGEPDEDDQDEHPVTIRVAPDITPDGLAELIILHPYIEVWRGMVAATDPLYAGEMWDRAMTIADRLTAP